MNTFFSLNAPIGGWLFGDSDVSWMHASPQNQLAIDVDIACMLKNSYRMDRKNNVFSHITPNLFMNPIETNK